MGLAFPVRGTGDAHEGIEKGGELGYFAPRGIDVGKGKLFLAEGGISGPLPDEGGQGFFEPALEALHGSSLLESPEQVGEALASEREAVLAVVLVDFFPEGNEGILHEVLVAPFEFVGNLLGEHEVEGFFLGSAAGDENRDEEFDLVVDAVAEGEFEILVGPVEDVPELGPVGLVHLLVLVFLGGFVERHELRIGNRIGFGDPLDGERLVPFVEGDDDRAVVDLVGDRVGRVVAVGRADEPGRLRDLEGAVGEMLRGHEVIGDVHDLQVALVDRVFHDREEVGEVVLDPGDVHFVEDHDVDVLRLVGGLVEANEEVGLVVGLAEVVPVAEDRSPVAPGGLDRDEEGFLTDEG